MVDKAECDRSIQSHPHFSIIHHQTLFFKKNNNKSAKRHETWSAKPSIGCWWWRFLPLLLLVAYSPSLGLGVSVFREVKLDGTCAEGVGFQLAAATTGVPLDDRFRVHTPQSPRRELRYSSSRRLTVWSAVVTRCWTITCFNSCKQSAKFASSWTAKEKGNLKIRDLGKFVV